MRNDLHWLLSEAEEETPEERAIRLLGVKPPQHSTASREEKLAAARAAAAARRAARASGGASEEDPETDIEAQARAQAMKRAAEPPGAGRGPEGERSVGPRQHGPEFSDPEDPSRKQSSYYPGEMSPEMAGERSKAERVVDDVKQFIEKYSRFAVDRFYGATPGTVKQLAGPEATQTWHDRFGRRGAVQSMSQLMDKKKALKLIDDLPMMPQEEIFGATRALANYIWKIHSNARRGLRQEVAERLKKQGQLPLRKKEWQGS